MLPINKTIQQNMDRMFWGMIANKTGKSSYEVVAYWLRKFATSMQLLY
jgi:hypothetical protein